MRYSFIEVLDLFLEHSFGNHQPNTIRCGYGWYWWLQANLRTHARSLGYMPITNINGNILFNEAEVVLDENLLVSEVCVEPVYPPTPYNQSLFRMI